MKYAFAQVAFGLGANALIARDAPQCVQLKASGGASGILGQYTDGQNRIGGGYPAACYCLSNGGFTDSSGRGCLLTQPTTQWQCDKGGSPTTGFAIGSNGGVTYNGSGKFYACPYNTNGGYNIYSQPAPGQAKCVEISLSSAGSCGKSAQSSPAPAPSSKPAPAPSQPAYTPKPAPSPAPSPQPSKPVSPPPAQNTCPAPKTVTVTVTAPCASPAPPASMPAAQPSMPAAKPSMPAAQPSMPAAQPSMPAQQPSGSCPADLNGNYQYPHLIVPVNSGSPNKPYGTSYNGMVDSSTCSIFNFDIPASYSGKSCSVVFLFPQQKDLQTSSYTTSGSGSCSFSQLSGPASQSTTWSNMPGKKSDLGSMSIAPGNSYTIASGSCAAGQTVTYKMCSSGSYALNYFQDYNPSPIGMYVRAC